MYMYMFVENRAQYMYIAIMYGIYNYDMYTILKQIPKPRNTYYMVF